MQHAPVGAGIGSVPLHIASVDLRQPSFRHADIHLRLIMLHVHAWLELNANGFSSGVSSKRMDSLLPSPRRRNSQRVSSKRLDSLLPSSRFPIAELKEAKLSATELKAIGFFIWGFSIAELKAAGFSSRELMVAGFPASELKAA